MDAFGILSQSQVLGGRPVVQTPPPRPARGRHWTPARSALPSAFVQTVPEHANDVTEDLSQDGPAVSHVVPLPASTQRRWRSRSPGTWQNDIRPFTSHNSDRVDALPHTRPIVILPGFGNCAEDYAAPSGVLELGIVAHLKARGFQVEVLSIQRKDWAKVLKSLLTRAYWARSCTVDPAYTWYLQQVKIGIDAARLKYGTDEVTLLAHSAGGWLARAFLADEKYFDAGESHAAGTRHNKAVSSIVTLGSPHIAPPADTRDMTGGALTWVNQHWPDSHFASEGVKYACIAGCSVRGNGRAHRRELSRYSYSAYMQVLGLGHRIEGDSVVPNRSAFLEGADNLLVDGVFHSPSRLSDPSAAAQRPWYGSDCVIDAWADRLL